MWPIVVIIITTSRSETVSIWIYTHKVLLVHIDYGSANFDGLAHQWS